MGGYAGADWVESALKKPMSDFGRQVADLLGDLFLGIYHIQRAVKGVDFNNQHYVQIAVYGSLATYDSDLLTRLVFLCHERAIRCEIEPCNMQRIRLTFHPRKRDGSHTYERHPTIEQAIARLRQAYRDCD